MNIYVLENAVKKYKILKYKKNIMTLFSHPKHNINPNDEILSSFEMSKLK